MIKKINNVEEAKSYIEYFNKYVAQPAPITFVDTNFGKRIVLSDMNDEDAIFVANGLMEIEVNAARMYNGVKQ